MDIREKIGQRLVFGFPGTTIPAEFAALVREYKIGNVILFRYNIESLPQLARLCADIQELIRGATGRDAFITIDQEGGMVTRLPWDAVNVPGSMALAATGKPENAVLAAEITARQLRGVGGVEDLRALDKQTVSARIIERDRIFRVLRRRVGQEERIGGIRPIQLFCFPENTQKRDLLHAVKLQHGQRQAGGQQRILHGL